MRCTAIALAVGLLASAASGCTGSGTPSADRARQLAESGIAAARLARSVHYVLATPQDVGVGTTTGDVSFVEGRQQISNPDGGRVTTLLVNGTAYFNGNAAGLRHIGIPASTVNQLNGRWVVVPSTAPTFRSVVDQVTLSSVLRYITPTGTLAERGSTHAFGQDLIVITGGIPQALQGGQTKGTSTLYLSAQIGHLPVAFEYRTASSTVPDRWLFTAWGQPVHVTAPTGQDSTPTQ